MSKGENKILNIDVNKNRNETSQESQENIILHHFPIVLSDCISSWTAKQRTTQKNPYLNGYRELSLLTGRAEQTLRSYVNEYSVTYPPIDVLVSICKAIDDDTPLKFLEDYRKAVFNGNE